MDDAIDAVDEARQTDTHGLDFGMLRPQNGDDLQHLLNQRRRVVVKLGVDRVAVREQAAVLNHGRFDRRPAKVDPDGFAFFVHEC